MRRWMLYAGFCMALWLEGCDEDAPRAERWVYWHQDALIETGVGLARFGLVSGNSERVAPQQCLAISNVAANGVVLMRRDDGLYGLCENGTLVNVPVPVPSDARWTIDAIPDEGIALAHDGHHAVYKAWLRPIAAATRDSSWRQQLVMVNCATGTTAMVDIDSAARALYRGGGCNSGTAAGTLLISRDGSTVYFVLEASRFDAAGAPSRIAQRIMEWRSGVIRAADADRGAEALTLRGYDETTRTLVVESATGAGTPAESRTVRALIPGGRDRRTLPISAAQLVEPRQFAVARSMVAVGGDEGIELRSPVDGRLQRVVVSWTDLTAAESLPRNVLRRTSRLALSPDGEYIACAVTWEYARLDPPIQTVVYALRTSGVELRRVAAFAGSCTPAVSNLLFKK